MKFFTKEIMYVVLLILFPDTVLSQSIEIDLGEEFSITQRSIQLILLITTISLVPAIAVTITCFPFILTVLSILRQAIGLQQSPPNMLIVSLALFLTYYVMEPVLIAAWAQGAEPLIEGIISLEEAFMQALDPFRQFMSLRVSPDNVDALVELRNDDRLNNVNSAELPSSILIPAFLLSEIERAFQIGFLIFLPFLIIDLVVAAVLMSMGMMMVPPAIVSLPFKLAFFVISDGWALISGALVRSYT